MSYRHGIRQLRTGWSDGPAYITQCPIQPGQSYLYNFTITGQRGTLFWHAHISWLRSTLHGAIVILPKKGTPYPFPKPAKEKIIVLGKNTLFYYFLLSFICYTSYIINYIIHNISFVFLTMYPSLLIMYFILFSLYKLTKIHSYVGYQQVLYETASR